MSRDVPTTQRLFLQGVEIREWLLKFRDFCTVEANPKEGGLYSKG